MNRETGSRRKGGEPVGGHYHALEALVRWHEHTGGFRSGEQATGNPFGPTAIETCCTVAWIALTRDYLRLTGDPAGADNLGDETRNDCALNGAVRRRLFRECLIARRAAATPTLRGYLDH